MNITGNTGKYLLLCSTFVITVLLLSCEENTEQVIEFGGGEILKQVMLNVDMKSKREQLFHVEPIVTRRGKNAIVDLVALVGIPHAHEYEKGKWELDSIEFKLVNDDINSNRYNLHIHDWSLIEKPHVMDTLVVNAGSDALVSLRNTLIFRGTKPKHGYKNDIKFEISSPQKGDSFQAYNGIKGYSVPRICTWQLY